MNTTQNKRSELLQQILSNTNSWLHFAEAKNAALIAFNVALVTGIIEVDWLADYFACAMFTIIGFISAIIVAVWSFKPVNKALSKIENNGFVENLLHFAYVASLEQDEYLQSLYARYWKGDDGNNFTELEKDYCEEIIEIARITMKKQKCFEIGLYINIFMIFLFGILVIYA